MTGPSERAISPPIRQDIPGAHRLVGRTNERGLLSDALQAASNGTGRLILLSGEAGIGKTSLARDLAIEAEATGIQFETGHCFDVSSAPPYGPWLEVFRRHRSDTSWPDPPAAFRNGELGPVPDQAALFAEVRSFFEDLAASLPLFLLLEDLHWADPASVELLRSLAPALADMPMLVIATYRHDELPRRHTFAQMLPALVREGDSLRLELKRLDGSALLLLIRHEYRLSSADAVRLSAYLERHTDGNPFFAVELLRSLEEAGLLRVGSDISQLGELARVVVPSLIQHVIDSRVTRMGEATRGPLEIAAVIGQEVPLALWAALADLEDEALLAIVERAAAAHLIEAMPNGTHVRFVHALTREAIYEGILPPRRRLWHERIAEVMASEPNPNPDAVALHFQLAGDIRAVEWLQRAADQAQRAYAWLTAAELLRSAANIIKAMEGQSSTYNRLILRISYLLRFSYPAEAAELLNETDERAARSGDHIASALISHLHGVLLCYSDHFRAGIEHLSTGLQTLLDLSIDANQVTKMVTMWLTNTISEMPAFDRAAVVSVERTLHAAGFHTLSGADLWYFTSTGQAQVAIERQRQFLAMLSGLPSIPSFTDAMRAFLLNGQAAAHAALGEADIASQHGHEAVRLFGSVGHHMLVAFTLLGLLRDVELTCRARNPSLRRQRAEEAAAALARAGGALRPGVSPRLAFLGCFVVDGRWKDADEILRDLPDPGNVYLRREVTTTNAFLARQRAEPLSAWNGILRLLPEGDRTEPGDTLFLEGLFLQRLAAELCIDAGDLDGARGWLEAHDRWLAWGTTVLGRADGQLMWAIWHQAVGDVAAARDCAAQTVSLASSPDQPLVLLAAHRIMGELEATSGNPDSAESHLEVSLALATACDAPFERALTLLALAKFRMEMKQAMPVEPLLDEARAICEGLGAVLVLARIAELTNRLTASKPGSTHPAGLTAREQQVLLLVAAQKTDKEIAEALFISPHTASTHVKHVLAKLGVSSRREAAGYAASLENTDPDT
ncbi:MAG: AAA family ATPase [Thermomicrobiales bacterium]